VTASAIESPDQLRAALELFELVHPGAMQRGGRDAQHFRRLLDRSESVLLAVEGRDSVRGVLLATPGIHGDLYFDTAVAPGDDDAAIESALIASGLEAARTRGWASMFTSAGGPQAVAYEAGGFVPTLLVQLRGDDRHARRDDLVREFSERRVLARRDYGSDVAQVHWRIDRVDLDLDRALRLPDWRQYTTWLMHRWVDPEARPRFVIGFHHRYARAALVEAKQVDPELEVEKRLDTDAAEVRAGRPGHSLEPAFVAQPPVFVHHTVRVVLSAQLDGTSHDLLRLVDAARQVPLDPSRTFAVECRMGRVTISGRHNETAYTSRDVEIRAGTAIAESGVTADLVRPDQVLVIYLEGSRALLGVSSGWTDQVRRSAARLISRAEHKLAEALDVFGLDPRPGWRALDLGAAPGGWTYLLARRGVDVTAVDPAVLLPEVVADPHVTHLAMKAEDATLPDGSYELIVNDMVMDPEESAVVMSGVARCLRPDGTAVMTLKLPYRNPWPSIERAKRALAGAYEVVAVRHLPHNRQEVTAHLRPRVHVMRNRASGAQ
jgi:23S rRNA (cytidine2498-2'-O)-methyltransferase